MIVIVGMGMIMRMFVGMFMVVIMPMVVAVRQVVIMVVAALAVFYRKFTELAAIAGHQGFGCTAFYIPHPLLQHLKNFPLKAKIIG